MRLIEIPERDRQLGQANLAFEPLGRLAQAMAPDDPLGSDADVFVQQPLQRSLGQAELVDQRVDPGELGIAGDPGDDPPDERDVVVGRGQALAQERLGQLLALRVVAAGVHGLLEFGDRPAEQLARWAAAIGQPDQGKVDEGPKCARVELDPEHSTDVAIFMGEQPAHDSGHPGADTRLEAEVDGRIAEHCSDVGLAAAQVPGDLPVVVDDLGEVGRGLEPASPQQCVGPAAIQKGFGHGRRLTCTSSRFYKPANPRWALLPRMTDPTIKRLDEIDYYRGDHEIPGIRFHFAGKQLGVSAWGMNVLSFDPDVDGYPEHDHVGDGQEEVYVVLRGSVTLITGDQRAVLEAGTMARVGPATKRKLLPGPEGATVLAIGATPGKAYELRG